MALAGYPPAKHILGDLGIEAEVTTTSTAKVRIRATPSIAGADGGVRAGVLAVLVDVVGGAVAIRSVLPDWMATADLAIQTMGRAAGPWVEARATILRRGRTTLVVEALVFNTEHDGSPAVGDGAGPGPVAWATMTFTILPGRSATTGLGRPEEPPVRWAFGGEGLEGPLTEALSITVVDAAGGRVTMPTQEYASNSFGAVQGGVMALLADVAGGAAVGSARAGAAGPVVVTDLLVTYLALGRVGPIESRATVEGTDDGGAPRSAVVELFDRGADDRLTTVVTVGTAPLDGVPPAGGARVTVDG